MTAHTPDEAVTVNPARPSARVFRVGDIVASEDGPEVGGAVGWIYGEVISTLGSEVVTVKWRGLEHPQVWDPDGLEPVDMPKVIRTTLALLAQVGLKVTGSEIRGGALVLSLDGPEDLFALGELAAHGPFEFGCDWPTTMPTGLRSLIADEGEYGRTIHLADLPVLADLAQRELKGEFGGDESGIRRRWLLRSARQVACLILAVLAVKARFLGGIGPFGILAGVLLAAGLVFATVRIHRSGPSRTTLDAARRRTRKGGPR